MRKYTVDAFETDLGSCSSDEDRLKIFEKLKSDMNFTTSLLVDKDKGVKERIVLIDFLKSLVDTNSSEVYASS